MEGNKWKIDESTSDSSQVHRAKELYMNRTKQLQIMNNLRTRYCYRMYGSGGHGVMGTKGCWIHIHYQCRGSLKIG